MKANMKKVCFVTLGVIVFLCFPVFLYFGLVTYAIDFLSLCVFLLGLSILLSKKRNSFNSWLTYFCGIAFLFSISVRTVSTLPSVVGISLVSFILLVILALVHFLFLHRKDRPFSNPINGRVKETRAKLFAIFLASMWIILPFLSGRNIFVFPYATVGFNLQSLSWSYDGKNVTFIREPPAPYLHILNVHHRRVTPITLAVNPDYIACSPVDERIVLVTGRRDGAKALWLFDSRKNVLTKLREGGEGKSYYFCRWSPDGSKIAFWEKQRDRSGLYLLGLDNVKGQTELLIESSGVTLPEWSPEGDRIAYIQRRGKSNSLFLVDLKRVGAQPQLLVSRLCSSSVTWAPNGSWIVFARKQKGTVEMCEVQINTRQIRVLFSEKGEIIDSLYHSPDGKLISFRLKQGPIFGTRVCLYDVKKNKVEFLSPQLDLSFDPVLSPDGTELVWNSVFPSRGLLFHRKVAQTK